MNVESDHQDSRPTPFPGPPLQPGHRIELPVAGRAFARLRFAPAETVRPAMLPREAIGMLENMRSHGTDISEVHISGPGDSLADIAKTLETLREVRHCHADMLLSITTLGLNGDQYAEILAEHGVKSVTLLVEAIDPAVIKNLYAWIRPGTKTVPLDQAAALLAEEQPRAITAMIGVGMVVIVRTTVFPGINDSHVPAIAEAMAQLGVERMLLAPCRSFADRHNSVNAPDSATMAALRELAGRHLLTELVKNCAGPQESTPGAGFSTPAAVLPQPSKNRPNVAVVSSNGMNIDLHLGQAVKALVYGPREDGLACLLAARSLPEPGGGNSRWETLAGTFSDCFALLAAGAGENPRNILSRHGITTLITEGEVDGMVDVLYGGCNKGKQRRSEWR